MPVKLTKKSPAIATLTKETSNKGVVVLENTDQEFVDVPDKVAPSQKGHSGPWCEVGVEASYTHNLGNYQSARYGISLKVPCIIGEVNKVFEFTKAWVEERMQSAIEELQEGSA
jgi:hypothetical protein